MRHYKTVNEFKRNLPEILDRINTCKVMFDCNTMMLRDMERWCVEETVDPTKDHGWWTTLRAYTETLKHQMQCLSEIEYLQDLVKKVRSHPQI